MAKQRMLNTKFWSDPWIVDELNPLDRYLFLYLLTNEKTNISGAYELSIRTMSNETGIEKEELLRMLKRLESRVTYVLGWVVFRKAMKHQNYKSPKIETAIARELREIPKDVTQHMEIPNDLSKKLCDAYGINTVSIPYASGIALNLTKVTKVTKPNLTKPNVAEASVGRSEKTQEINGMFEYWESQVGYAITAKRKQNRDFASKLLADYEKADIALMIRGAALASEDQYAPGVSNFVDLYRKWDSLKLWAKKKGVSNEQRAVDLTT